MSEESKSVLITMLQEEEGFSSVVYRCQANKLTIGYGRNLEDRGISKAEALMLLSNDIKDVLKQCKSLNYWEKLSDMRKIVVADMVYNLGFEGFKKFKRMNLALELGNYERAASEMEDSKWFDEVFPRSLKLKLLMLNDK